MPSLNIKDYIIAAMGALLVLLCIGWTVSSAKVSAKLALQKQQYAIFQQQVTEAANVAIKDAQDKERGWQQDNARIQQEVLDAQRQNDMLQGKLAADVRTGAVVVRKSLCESGTHNVSSSASTASQFNAGTQDAGAIVAAAIRAGADCDSQVKGLQKVIRSYMGDRNGRIP